MNNLLNRFLHYVSFDSQSSPDCDDAPSTPGQMVLARVLCDELAELGFEQVTLSEHGCLMATLPANVDWPTPTIGFISHMDTSPDCSGKNIKPQIVERYPGGDIALGQSGEVLSPSRFPALDGLVGQTLITTDGTTLLGADDKAGVSEIVTAMLRLNAQNVPHGKIRIAFTPDEEVGRGTEHFDIEAFGAEWAYTVDGGAVGELECENFNAASADITIVGNNVHPGSAKGVMVNAMTVATRLHQALPDAETPEHTADREGFYHLVALQGTVERCSMQYIIRDFERDGFARRKARIAEVAHELEQTLPDGCRIDVTLTDSYYNMREAVAEHPHVVELARQAMRDLGIAPLERPIRGGTDGAQLSLRGLPCPNLFTGGYNFHGKHEFATLDGMEQAVAVIMRIAELTARQSLAARR